MTVDVLFLCTGNAARSVMAGVSLTARRPDLAVATAGTLVVDGQPMSIRTRKAIQGLGWELPVHASRQVTPDDLDRAAAVIALAPEHVEWVRRTHPPAAAHTATLPRLVRALAPADGNRPVRAQLADLALDTVVLEDWEEVVDPGGGDEAVFAACAVEVDALIERLAPRLGTAGSATNPS